LKEHAAWVHNAVYEETSNRQFPVYGIGLCTAAHGILDITKCVPSGSHIF